MKNLDNTYLVNNTVYSKGPSSCGYSFLKYFLRENKDIKSILGMHEIRILTIWLSRVFWGILVFRVER